MGGVGAHAGADLAFDQSVDEQREELAAEQGFDAGGVLEQDGCGVLHGFEQVVAASEVGLVAVGGRHRGVG